MGCQFNSILSTSYTLLHTTLSAHKRYVPVSAVKEKDYIIPRLFPLYHSENSVALLIFWVSFPLKAPLWKHSSVKILRLHFLIELPQPFIFHLKQLLFSRFFCHKSTTFLLPSKTPIGGLYYQYILFYLFDLSKKGYFSLPFPTPKNTYRGLILSIYFILPF